MKLDAETVSELAECVRKNEGLRKSITARGLDVRETLAYLRANHRELFRDAKAGVIPEPAPVPAEPAPQEPKPEQGFVISGTATTLKEGVTEYALEVTQAKVEKNG